MESAQVLSKVGPNRKLVPSSPRLSFWTVWFRHNQDSRPTKTWYRIPTKPAGLIRITTYDSSEQLNVFNLWNLLRIWDCRLFSVLKTLTGSRAEKSSKCHKTRGVIHSTKISGNFGPKLNGSVRSNRKSFEKTGPPFEVVLFSRSDRSGFWLNGSRPRFRLLSPAQTKHLACLNRHLLW